MPIYTQTKILSPNRSDWTGAVAFDRIDPAQGPILSIDLTLTGTITSGFVVESREQAAALFTSTDSASVVLRRPDGTSWLTVAPTDTAVVGLAPGEGAVRRLTGLVGTGSASVTYKAGGVPSADAGLLVGMGQVLLPVTATERVHATGPGNLDAQFTSTVAASVSTVFQTGAPTAPDNTSGSTTTIAIDPGGFTVIVPNAVTTAAQQRSIALDTTGWTHDLQFTGFDPALGRLISVNLTLTPTVAGQIAAENLDSVAAAIAVQQRATVSAVRADGRVLDSVSATRGDARTLAAYDGTLDYAGASGNGTTASDNAAPASVAVMSLTDAADIGAFIGTGTVFVPFISTGRTTIDGPGNLAIQTALQAGVTATVSYTYLPGGAPTVPALDPSLISTGGVTTIAEPIPSVFVGVGDAAVLSVAPAALTVATRGRAELVRGASLQGGTVAGSLTVDAGASAADTVIGSGGVVTVAGAVTRLTLNGGTGIVQAGGRSQGSMISEVGTEIVAGGVSTRASVGQLGSQVVRAGGTSIAAAVNGGRVSVESGGTADGTMIGRGGVVTIEAGGSLRTPQFAASAATLTLDRGALVSGITGFGQGDVIDVRDLAFTGDTAAALDTAGHLTITAGLLTQTLSFTAGGFSASDIRLSADAAGSGTQITLDPTQIATIGGLDAATAYAGPVLGIENQYIAITPQNTVIAAAGSDNWFLHGGVADDALQAHGGRNVLDGGAGSNFLVGGSGQNTFFVTAVPGVTTWSTVAGAHTGDDVTLWGLRPDAVLHWQDGAGAAGYTGLTLRTADASATFAGFTMADLTSGRLAVGFGDQGGLSYLHVGVMP